MIPENPGPLLIAISIFELLLIIAGIVTLYRLLIAPAGKSWQRLPSPLPHWPINIVEFILAFLAIVVGGIVGQLLSGIYAGRPGLDENTRLMIYGAGFQAGLLAGAFVALFNLRRQVAAHHLAASETETVPLPAPSISTGNLWRFGGITFLASIPTLMVINLSWTFLLETFGFDTSKQELIDLFANTDSLSLLITMSVLAVIIAPLAEELIFRAGFFRFLRNRVPTWLAYTLPSAVFASLHGNLVAFLPLMALGMIFSYSYERTGNLHVPIIAHSIFNLHTILLLISGVEA